MKKVVSVFFLAFAAILSLTHVDSKVSAAPAVSVSGKAAYLVDCHSGTVIFESNADRALPIASMTKIMTLLLTFEEIDGSNLSLEEKIVASPAAAGMGGSQAFLEAGGEYRVRDLVKSVIVASANDASVALAERIAGSEEAFTERMNERAKQLGMSGTVFANCTGLPKAGQHSTAKDVSVMLRALVGHPGYFEFGTIWMDEIEHPGGRKTGLTNTNKLVKFYEGCDGGKTGYTSEAGHCLAATAKRGGMRLVAVEIAAPDSKTRFRDVSSMFDFGFSHYTNKVVAEKGKALEQTVEVARGKSKRVAVAPEADLCLFSERNAKEEIALDFTPYENVKAPVCAGERVGTLSVYRDGVLRGEVGVVALESVEKSTYLDALREAIRGRSLS